MIGPASRAPVGLALVVLLGLAVSALQARFDEADVRKAIALAMGYRPSPEGPSLLEALSARGEGSPRCDGTVASAIRGEVLVRCATPGRASLEYRFRVRIDEGGPPRPEGAAAEALVAGRARLAAPPPAPPSTRSPRRRCLRRARARASGVPAAPGDLPTWQVAGRDEPAEPARDRRRLTSHKPKWQPARAGADRSRRFSGRLSGRSVAGARGTDLGVEVCPDPSRGAPRGR